MMPTPMTRTRKALELYDAFYPLFRQGLNARDLVDAREVSEMEDAYSENVGRAFYEDMKPTYTLVTCLLLHPGAPSAPPTVIRQLATMAATAEAAGRRI